MKKIILASTSSRRKELFEKAGRAKEMLSMLSGKEHSVITG